MGNLSRARAWLEAGKKIGKSASFQEADERWWVSVGVEQWRGEYRVYFCKAKAERTTDLDSYEVEGVLKVTRFEELPELLAALGPIKFAELTPPEGQRIFNVFCN